MPKTIPTLKNIPPYPQRKDPQDRFDELIKAAVDGGSEMVAELNTKFIPAANAFGAEVETNKNAVGESAAAAASSATAANTAKTAAETARAAAETAKNAAVAAKTQAEAAKTGAESAQAAAETAKTQAVASAASASESAATATAKAEDTSDSASIAATKAEEADDSATDAASSAVAANTAKMAAESAKTTAETAKNAAATAKTQAEAAQTGAENAQAAAETARTAAETAQSAAETARTQAAASAAGASESAATATAKAEDASDSASIAATKAEKADDSATAAASSAVAANTAKTAAEFAKAAAETAQSAAVTAKTQAEAAETGAEKAQTAAETARTAAETAQRAAETAKVQAVASASGASESAATATSKAKDASDSASIAATKAEEADDSATAAASSAVAANTAKTAAEFAKAAAETAQSAAVTAKTQAEAAETGAEKAQTAAEAAKIAIESSKEDAAASATDAAESADEAARAVQGVNLPVPGTQDTGKTLVWTGTAYGLLSYVDGVPAPTPNAIPKSGPDGTLDAGWLGLPDPSDDNIGEALVWKGEGYETQKFATSWPDIPGKPETFPPSEHGHTVNDVSGLQALLNLKADTMTVNTALVEKADATRNQTAHDALTAAITAAEGKATWEGLTGKPETFPPSDHGHEWAEISGTPVIASASTTQEGVILIASDEEATAGLNTTKAVTPKQLKDAVPILVDIQPLSGLDTVGIGHTNTFGLQAKSALIRGSVASFTVSVTGLAEPTVQTLPAIDGAATIQITPPEDTPAGIVLTLTAIATDNSGYMSLPTTKDVTVMTAFVAAPTLTAPEANAVVSPITVTFATSAFSTVGSSDTHVASRYKLTTDAAGNTVVYDSGRTTTDKLTHTATLTTQLTPGATHYAWAQHEGTVLGVGSWSAPVALVVASVRTPTILSPEANAIIGAGIVTIVTSDFACTGGLQDTHISTDWRITSDEAGSIVIDEALASSDKIIHIFTSPPVTEDSTYYFCARHTGTITGTSNWAKVPVTISTGRHGEILYDTDGTPAAVICGTYASNGKEPWTIRGRKVWLAVALAAKRGVSLLWGNSATDGIRDVASIEKPKVTWKLAKSNTSADSAGSTVSLLSTEEHMDETFTYLQPVKDSEALTNAIITHNVDYQAAKYCRNITLRDYGTMDLPSIDALMRVYQNRSKIDALDPTANANTAKKLSNWGFGSESSMVWSSSMCTQGNIFFMQSLGNVTFIHRFDSLFGVVPVLEIPATIPA